MHTITRILAATLLFTALPACDSGTPTPDAKKVVTKAETKPASKPADPKPVVAPVVTPETKPEEKPAADPADNKIQLAALVAKEISGAPDKADEILNTLNLDRDKLDALMFEIAADPALTKRYMDARSGA